MNSVLESLEADALAANFRTKFTMEVLLQADKLEVM